MRVCSEAKNATLLVVEKARPSPRWPPGFHHHRGLALVFVEIRNLEDRQAQQDSDQVNQVVLGRRTRHLKSRVHGQGRRTGPDLDNLTVGNPWPAWAFASDDLTRYAR